MNLKSFGVVFLSAALAGAAVYLQIALKPASMGLVIACTAVVVGLMIVRFSGGRVGPLSPIALIGYCQVLIFVARPAFAVAYQDSRSIFTLNPYDASMLIAQAYAGIGFIAICAGYSVRNARERPAIPLTPVRPFTDETWRRLVIPMYCVIAIGFGLYSVYVLQIGWSGYWSATLSGRSNELRAAINSNSGYFYSGLQFAIGALLLVIFQNALKGSVLRNVVPLILLFISMFPQVASGSRSVFIPVIVALLYILHVVRPSVLKVSRVLVWGPVVFVLGFVAPRIWRDNLAVGGSLWDSIQLALSPESLFDNFFGGLDTAMVDAYAIQLAAQGSGDLDSQLGATYAGLLASVVPRALWPGKPESVDELLNAVLFPETAAKHIGFAFGYYSEPTLNFGLPGVIVVSILTGYVLAAVTTRAARLNSLESIFVLMMTSSYTFPIMRGSLSFDSQRLLISLLPVVVIFIFVRPHDFKSGFLARDIGAIRPSNPNNKLIKRGAIK